MATAKAFSCFAFLHHLWPRTAWAVLLNVMSGVVRSRNPPRCVIFRIFFGRRAPETNVSELFSLNVKNSFGASSLKKPKELFTPRIRVGLFRPNDVFWHFDVHAFLSKASDWQE
jgi:hypothetical protein